LSFLCTRTPDKLSGVFRLFNTENALKIRQYTINIIMYMNDERCASHQEKYYKLAYKLEAL